MFLVIASVASTEVYLLILVVSIETLFFGGVNNRAYLQWEMFQRKDMSASLCRIAFVRGGLDIV